MNVDAANKKALRPGLRVKLAEDFNPEEITDIGQAKLASEKRKRPYKRRSPRLNAKINAFSSTGTQLSRHARKICYMSAAEDENTEMLKGMDVYDIKLYKDETGDKYPKPATKSTRKRRANTRIKKSKNQSTDAIQQKHQLEKAEPQVTATPSLLVTVPEGMNEDPEIPDAPPPYPVDSLASTQTALGPTCDPPGCAISSPSTSNAAALSCRKKYHTPCVPKRKHLILEQVSTPNNTGEQSQEKMTVQELRQISFGFEESDDSEHNEFSSIPISPIRNVNTKI